MKKTVVFAFACGLFVGLADAAPACRQLEAGLPHEVVLPFPQGLPKTVRVLPLSFAGDVAYETNAVRLCLKDPVRLRVDFGGDAPSQTVFVRPRDTVTLRSTDLYFAPGTHQAGEIVPKAGTRVILARGVVVRGETGDDFIALTALDSPWFERKWARPGRDRAIRDITIRHVKGRTNQCALIRILSHFGQPIHHVTIADVVEDSVPGRHNQTQMAVRIGDRLPAYYANDERNAQRFGDIHDIQVDGLTTRALSAVHTDDGIRNLTVRNVRLFGDAGSVWTGGTFGLDIAPFIYLPAREGEVRRSTLTPGKMEEWGVPRTDTVRIENVLFDGVTVEATPHNDEALFRFRRAELVNCRVRNLRAPAGRKMCDGDARGDGVLLTPCDT